MSNTEHNTNEHEKKDENISLWHKMYVGESIAGLIEAIKHVFVKKPTVQYPEEKKELPTRFRGEHRLKTNDQGQIKCVACYMCSTACPAQCIHIEAEEAPKEWEGRDKVPATFVIDELRCIYCGFCIEACPKDAIEMITKPQRVYYDRQEYIYDKDFLLKNEGTASKWQLEKM